MRYDTHRQLTPAAGPALLIITIMLMTPLATAGVTAEWVGGGGDALWSNGDNWDIGVAPCNAGPASFDVVIDPGTPALVILDVTCTVDSLTLGAGHTLRLLEGGVLSVDGAAAIGGLVDGDGGDLFAEGEGTAFTGDQARILAADGSQIHVAAQSYTCTVIATILRAEGAGTLVDLASVEMLSVAFPNPNSQAQISTITATGGGVIDLSGVATITPPQGFEDRLDLVIPDADSTIDLSSLVETFKSGGYTRFLLEGGAVQTLPALETAGDLLFNLSGGAQLHADGPAPIDYDASGIFAQLMVADGAGTLLDLSSVTMLSAAFANPNTQLQTSTITATGGGVIDLSGVATITPPQGFEDRLDLVIPDADSTIDLSSLVETFKSGGYTRFLLEGGAVQTLPALETAGDLLFNLSGGAQLHADGPAPIDYDASGIFAQLMRADGPGTLLDLASVTTLSAAFANPNSQGQLSTITATAGGAIDLSGLATIAPPQGFEDRLDIVIPDADSTIDLSSLVETFKSGGYTRFLLEGGAVQTLPALETAGDLLFNLSGGAQLHADGPAPIDYDASGIFAQLMVADGAGTLLDLSSVTMLSAAFANPNSQGQFSTITATAGGTIDLSGLATITPPQGFEDRLDLVIPDADSTIDLSSLVETFKGGGYTRFLLEAGAMQTLPALEIAGDLLFNLSGGAQLHADGPAPIDYDATGIFGQLMRADGAGTLLDLSSATTLSVAFANPNSQGQFSSILATNGGTVDLSEVRGITTPTGPEDWLAMTVDGDGATLDLRSLEMLDGGGNATATVTSGALIVGDLGDVTSDLDISLDDDDALLHAPGALLPGDLVDIAAASGTVRVEGRFCFHHADEDGLALAPAHLIMRGPGTFEDRQSLEVGGLDLGGLCAFGNDNFGYDRITIGADDQPTVVELRDGHDNGNTGGGNPETLHVYALDGLSIRGGSTLILRDLNLYLCEDGTNVRELFPRDVDEIPWDEGFIQLGEPCGPAADIDCSGAVDVSDLVAVILAWGDCPDPPAIACPADVTCDGEVDVADLVAVILDWD